MKRVCALLLLFAALFPLRLLAHSSSEAFLDLQIDGNVASGAWDFALQDLEHAVGVDVNGDGAITWAEVRQRQHRVVQYILSGVRLTQLEKECAVHVGQLMLRKRHHNTLLHVPVKVQCQQPLRKLTISYQLFFRYDNAHHAYWKLTTKGRQITRVSTATSNLLTIDL